MKIANKIQLVIPDSCVMLKWCVWEAEDREQIVKMQDDFVHNEIQIAFPAILEWELNNYLGRKLSEEEATRKYSYFKILQATMALLTLEMTGLAFKIMKKCPSVSFYDASYHAMALHMKGVFLTADKKYYDKTKSLGNIQLLKDYK